MRFFVIVATLLGLLPAVGGAAPSIERWSATSTTAMGVTGDITLSPTRLTAAGKVFPLAVAVDVRDFVSSSGPQAARILRVTRPSDPVLKNGNTFCGAPVRWIAVYRSQGGKNLNMSVFSSDRRPTGEVGQDVCGTFLYSR